MINKSIKSLIITAIGLAMVIFLAWFWAYQRGLSIKPEAPHQSAFLAGPHPRLFMSWDPELDLSSLNQKLEKLQLTEVPVWPALWICLKLHVVFNPLTPSVPPQSEAVVSDCQTGQKIVELENFSYPKEPLPVLLSLDTRQPGLEAATQNFLKRLSEEQKSLTLIQADADGVHKALRADFPLLAFGSSQAKLIQLEIAGTVGLMPLVQLSSDAIVSLQTETQIIEGSIKKRARFRDSTLKEAHRRGLKRYAGPAHSLEEARELFRKNLDGVLVPSSLLR